METRRLCRWSSDRWLKRWPARASDARLWRRQRRRWELEYRRARCRHVTTAVVDDAAARL